MKDLQSKYSVVISQKKIPAYYFTASAMLGCANPTWPHP